ncbi:LCP family protein [Nocardioides montaniterrae]
MTSHRRGRRRRRIGRFFRHHKAMAVMFGLIGLLLAIVLGWALYLNAQLGDVRRFPITPPAAEPARFPGGAMNILLIGADDPDDDPNRGPNIRDELAHGGWTPGAFRSDTTMVLHLDAGRRSGQLISIPRDSWVPIPGHGRSKINAAFSWGGPSLLRTTVEDLTGLYIDHVVVIDFNGFVTMSEIVGGVDVYVPQTVTDYVRDKVWTKGEHHLEGEDALLYVRQRYGLPNGDFDRIARQQNFLRELLSKMASRGVLSNPFRVTSLAKHLSDTIAVDKGLTTGRFRSLILSLAHFHPGDLRFVTAPVAGTGMEGSQSVVHLDLVKVRSLFKAVAASNFEGWYAHHQADLLPPTKQVG